MLILALNAGSSSLKFALYQADAEEVSLVLRGAAEEIARSRGRFWARAADGAPLCDEQRDLSDHDDALARVVAKIEQTEHGLLDAIGHRVVHGGTRFAAPVIVDETVLGQLRELIPFAPLHQPCEVALIEAAAARFPATVQIACFDTAVHRTLPEVAARFPLPRWLWDEGVRRYGFHGLSYEYVLDALPELKHGRTIIAHLGNGASMTAFRDGVSVETTMGFTPTGGLMMGTRCGDLDPGVVLYLLRRHGLTADELDRLVNQEAGLRGVSGKTSDLKTLLEAVDDQQAQLAVDMFCDRVCKHVGALASVLNGVDHLVFTGGIGERSPAIRAAICGRLTYLGVSIDPSLNEANQQEISPKSSHCRAHVVPTDEEHIIAQQTLRLLSHDPPSLRPGANNGV